MTASLHSPRTFYRYWLPPLLWCAGILVFSGDLGSSMNTAGVVEWLLSMISALSPGQIMKIHGYLRKTGHALAYGGLGFLWFRALFAGLGYRRTRSFSLALGLSLLVALLDEGQQSLFPSRGASFWDVALDMSAAFLVAGLTSRFWRLRFQTHPDLRQAAGDPPV